MQELFSDLAPKKLLEIGIDFAPKILAAILVLFAFWVAYRLTRRPLWPAWEWPASRWASPPRTRWPT